LHMPHAHVSTWQRGMVVLGRNVETPDVRAVGSPSVMVKSVTVQGHQNQSLDYPPSANPSLACLSLTRVCHSEPQRRITLFYRGELPCFRMRTRRVAPMPTLRLKFQPAVPRNEIHQPPLLAKPCGCSDDLIQINRRTNPCLVLHNVFWR
jgi:hypothetical protein